MTGYRRTILSIIIISFFIAGCGSTPPVSQTEAELELGGHTNRFIDWDTEDWKFLLPFYPVLYPESTNFDNLKYESPYAAATHYEPRFSPVNLAEFRDLPPLTQKLRREAAKESLYDAMAFNRIIAWSWEIWCRSRTQQVAQEAAFYKYGILTPAIQNLEKAAGEDPSNPFTWSHLAFFTGLVGNKTRQLEALENGFVALEVIKNHQELTPEKAKELHLMALRWLLDKAWLMRDKGQFTEGMRIVKTTMTMMVEDEYKTHAEGREALLLESLLLVDQGFYDEARINANQFKTMKLPILAFSGGSTPRTKHNLNHTESDFCRQWVWDMTHLKLENEAQALRPRGSQVNHLEYPPHLGYRYWQDMGRIREHFGQNAEAWSCYFRGLLCRPFLSFFPSKITNGSTPVFGQEDTGNFHFLGYYEFFLGGSEFAYAANRVASMEWAFGEQKLAKYGKEALETLTACHAKGIRPMSALALRGYAYTLLNQSHLAEIDLRAADLMFTEAGRENSQVLRLLVTLCYNRKAYLDSHDLLKRYLILHPEDASSWGLQGVILAQLNLYEEALKATNVSLELQPESTSGLFNRALVQLHLGRTEEAQKDLAKAGKLSPENTNIARMATLVRNDPHTTLVLEHQPQKWTVSTSDSLESQWENPAAGLPEEELSAFLTKAQATYLEKPSQESRLALCCALVENSQWLDVQNLMAPSWPETIDLQGTLFLLQADRALGQSQRAMILAQSLTTDSVLVASSRLWTMVAVICIENSQKERGAEALKMALELDPENQSLHRLKGQVLN